MLQEQTDLERRAYMWGMRPSQLTYIESRLGEKLIDIPAEFPFQKEPLSAAQFNWIKQDISGFKNEYYNAKFMIQNFNA